jgi:NADH dehydrogenase
MILVVGASGQMGSEIARQLIAAGEPVRAMSRESGKLSALQAAGAEVVVGDLRDPASLARACEGVDRLVTTANASGGAGDNAPERVDGDGNRHLIHAAKAAGVGQIVFISNTLAQPNSPVDFYRLKAATEDYLKASGIAYTIIRAAPLMDMMVSLFGEPIAQGQTARIFGGGANPISFIASADVARLAVLALRDPRAHNRTITIGGPEARTTRQIAETVAKTTGKPLAIRAFPLPLMRVIRLILRPINPVFARRLEQMIVLDTTSQQVDSTDTLRDFPLTLTRLDDYVRARYGSA